MCTKGHDYDNIFDGHYQISFDYEILCYKARHDTYKR